MSEFHITPELLAAVERGELPARLLTEAGWNHLMDLCPTCREGFSRWQKQRQPSTASYEAKFRILPFLLERQAGETANRQEQTEKDFRELLRLDPKTRLARIQRANTRFRGVPLANRLLAEAKEQMPANTDRQYELAEAADAVLLRSPPRLGFYDAKVRATAYRANALRASGQLLEAEKQFRYARRLLQQDEVTDGLVYAEVDWLQGSLLKDRYRLDEAERLLKRAAAIYRLHGAHTEAARPLIALGLMYYRDHNATVAIATTEAALDFLSPETEPRLYLCGRYNLAFVLVETGTLDRAVEILSADELLYEKFADLWTQLRKIWLLGRIAFRAARFEEAERAFLAVRGGFTLQGIGYNAAMASLDLARVYLAQRRSADVRRLAQEMRSLLKVENLHPEAQTALIHFEEAAGQEKATAELLRKLVSYL